MLLGLDTNPNSTADITGDGAADGPVSTLVARQARRIVDEQLHQAVALLRKNRPALDALAAELLKKNRLTREEMKELLDKHQP